MLAITFALYGLLRKIAPVPLTGLAVETLFLFPAAFTYICYLTGKGAFPSVVPENDFLLPLAGVVTAIPLLWFSAAARRLRLATIGFMQYITPTLHFILAVLMFGEPFSQIELSSFICIWAGLALSYTPVLQQRPHTESHPTITSAIIRIASLGCFTFSAER